jgi:hypothetical protein
MNLFQIGLLFSLPVHTYLPVKQVIDRFTMMEWLTLKWSATILWLKPPLCMPTACHLSGMVNFRRVKQVIDRFLFMCILQGV